MNSMMKIWNMMALILFMLNSTSEADEVSGMITTNKLYRQGGFGIVTGDVYINLNSTVNEIIYAGDKKWKGKIKKYREIVIIFSGKPVATDALPKDFELSKAIIVSFEGSKVRVLGYICENSGFYERE